MGGHDPTLCFFFFSSLHTLAMLRPANPSVLFGNTSVSGGVNATDNVDYGAGSQLVCGHIS